MNASTATRVVIEPARTSKLWSSFLDWCGPESDVFHSPEWLSVLSTTYGFEPEAHMLLDDDGDVRAGMVSILLDDPRGVRRVSLPFSDFCDPLMRSQEDWRELDRRLGADVPVRIRGRRNSAVVQGGGWQLASRARWHVVDLLGGPDEVWSRISARARRDVRAARNK